MANPTSSPPLSAALQDGASKTIIRCPDDVSPEQKEILRAYIRDIKKYTDPKDSVTDDELKKFLTMVFNHWTTADTLKPPSEKPVVPKFEDVTVRIGVLTKDAPTPEAPRRSKRLRLSSGWNIRDEEPPRSQKHPERKAGAPVYLRSGMLHDYWSAGCSYYVDSKCRYFSDTTIKFRYDGGLSSRVAKFLAVRKLDNFCFYSIHRRNVELAIYFARNRLAKWAAGSPLDEVPVEEGGHSFQMFKLFRNHVSSDSRMSPAGRLCALPRPQLFDLF